LISNIPFQNVALITETYRYEDKQQKKVGLYLHRDVDYRTLLGDIENQYAEEDLPDKEHLAEEIAI
jgi:predicted phosphodiesterase